MRPYRGMTKEGKWMKGDKLSIGKKVYICSQNFVPTAIYFVTKPNGEQINVMSHLLSGLIEVIPETVGQSTGREDENKEEIYTGDKIGFIPIDGSTKVRQIAEVYYDEKRTAFCVRGNAWNCPLSFCKEIEIITRNPELMGD